MHCVKLIPMNMEEQLQKRKTQTEKELPEEIIHDEILIRLPHKSLIRFRCVCKPWRSLFSDPEFIKVHFSRQCDDQNYLLKNTCDSALKIISRFKETRIDTTAFISNDSLLIGSINGLICFARPDVFTLWNPAIRQYKELSTAQTHDRICQETFHWNPKKDIKGNCRHVYGFGWDSTKNDYKVVIVCYVWPYSKHGAVYSCKSDSWTELVLPTGIFDVNFRSFVKSPSPTVVVKGCPYWSCSKYLTLPGKRYRRRYTVVFKFVAEKNEFKLLPDFDLAGQEGLKLINVRDCLVGMAYKKKRSQSYPYCNKYMDIYSLDHEGSAGVWSKMYTLGAPDFGLLNFVLSHEFKLVPRKLEQLLCYDKKTKTKKVLQKVVDAAPFELERFTYTPSLVFVHGMKHIMHSET